MIFMVSFGPLSPAENYALEALVPSDLELALKPALGSQKGSNGLVVHRLYYAR
jgi:hypothetical protein